MVNIDYTNDMILVAEVDESGKNKIVAIGGFFATPRPSLRELAFVVHEEWRGKGITKFLLNYLVKIGRELNYKMFLLVDMLIEIRLGVC